MWRGGSGVEGVPPMEGRVWYLCLPWRGGSGICVPLLEGGSGVPSPWVRCALSMGQVCPLHGSGVPLNLSSKFVGIAACRHRYMIANCFNLVIFL